MGSLSLLQRIFLTRNQTMVSCIAGGYFPTELSGKPKIKNKTSLKRTKFITPKDAKVMQSINRPKSLLQHTRYLWSRSINKFFFLRSFCTCVCLHKGKKQGEKNLAEINGEKSCRNFSFENFQTIYSWDSPLTYSLFIFIFCIND